MLKEQVLFLPLDEHSKTVTRVTVIGSPGRTEVAHCLDWEGTSIRTCDRCRLHIACRIKVGGYLYIDSLFCHKQSPPCLIVTFRAILHGILQKIYRNRLVSAHHHLTTAVQQQTYSPCATPRESCLHVGYFDVFGQKGKLPVKSSNFL